jgi:hypothetical protein
MGFGKDEVLHSLGVLVARTVLMSARRDAGRRCIVVYVRSR